MVYIPTSLFDMKKIRQLYEVSKNKTSLRHKNNIPSYPCYTSSTKAAEIIRQDQLLKLPTAYCGSSIKNQTNSSDHNFPCITEKTGILKYW